MNNNAQNEADWNSNPSVQDLDYRCSKCPYVSKLKHNLKRHEGKCKGEVSLTCEVCNKTFSTKFNLERHKMSHQSTGNSENNPFPCTMCDKTFKFEKK